MKFKLSYIYKLKILFPFLIVIFSDLIQISNKPLSTNLKLVAFVYMFIVVFLKPLNKNLTFLFLLFIPIFIYNIFHSFNLKAGLEDGIRYLFPVIVVFYGYTIRKEYKLMLYFIVLFTLLNDFWQIINYVYWIKGVDQWFYFRTWNGITYYNSTAGIIRATGIVVFFGLFGFINAVSFFIIYKFYDGKFKNYLMAITLIFIFLSFSFKIIGAFLIILFINYKKKVKLLLISFSLLFLTILIYPDKMYNIFDNIGVKISFYITKGDSARAESYKVMFKDMYNLNFFGRGIGSFGGPASMIYKSPLYKTFNFNWHKTIYLATTDTYYPHLFVELGLVGGILYLFILSMPLIRTTGLKRMDIVYAIYFLLFFDAIFSFSLNNLSYLMLSLALIYVIIECEKDCKKEC